MVEEVDDGREYSGARLNTRTSISEINRLVRFELDA